MSNSSKTYILHSLLGSLSRLLHQMLTYEEINNVIACYEYYNIAVAILLFVCLSFARGSLSTSKTKYVILYRSRLNIQLLNNYSLRPILTAFDFFTRILRC